MKLPKKPEHRFVFVTNIQDPIAELENPLAKITEAYLISERYTTKGSLEKTKSAKDNGCLIISDNGNFSRITAIAKTFEKEAADLLIVAANEVAANKTISKQTIEKRKKIVQSIVEACEKAVKTIGIEKITERQLMSNPDYMIGMEDFTIPVLDICGLLNPVFNVDAKEIIPFQNNTLKLYQDQCTGGFGKLAELKKVTKFLVLHSYDYDSAFLGGKNLSKAKKEGIAISFGGPMASREYITEIKIDNTTEKFSESLPEPYLIGAVITLGVLNGNKKNTPVHILGLGSPILILLLGYILNKQKAVSIDATSTFKDAMDGTIYGKTNGYLKMDMYKVAAYALIKNEPYKSSSPYFALFDKKYPSDWKALASKLKVSATDDPGKLADVLKSQPKLIEKYIPFFTPMRGGTDDFIKQVRLVRAGGNYWVLKDICEQIRNRINNETAIESWVQAEVDRYVNIASPKWSKAVMKTFELAKKHLY
jgi:hypothetical protein